MRKIILLMYLPFVFKGQDTIFKKDNTTILCKVTKATTSMIFYTENKIGKSISLSEVSRYSKGSEASTESKTSANNSATSCKIKKTFDKFEGRTQYKGDYPNWFEVTKYVKGTDTTYFLFLWSEGTTGVYLKEGVIVLFNDGTKFERPDAKIDCKFRAGTMYDYYAGFSLRENELELLKTKLTAGIRLYIFDRTWGDKKAENIKQQTICLSKEY